MSSTPYVLLHAIDISIPRPARDGEEQPPLKRTLTEIPLKPISARMYLEFGDVSILAQSPGGGSYEIELDDKIQGYLARRIEDPKDPTFTLARKAMHLSDAMALRADTIEALDLATDRAWRQRQGASPDEVTLLDPVEVHGETVRTVPLRCPTGADFDRLGQPYVRSRLADGSSQYVERTEVLSKYIGRCIAHEEGNFLLGLIKIADAIQIKMAVNDFFTAGVAEVNGARKRMLSSSTESSPPSATSAA